MDIQYVFWIWTWGALSGALVGAAAAIVVARFDGVKLGGKP